jgi:hypothetical protein
MKCCNNNNIKKNNRGFLTGLIYGFIPHIGCLGFIIFAILGVTAVTTLFRPLLLNPYFFYILIALSLTFATISALFYFKKQGFITLNRNKGSWRFDFQIKQGIKRKWKYLLVLYGTTISVNLIFFMLIFPVLTTLETEERLSPTAIADVFFDREVKTENTLLPTVILKVDIPCPGHALLITDELRTIEGVTDVNYRFPNRFIVNYDKEKTSIEKILLLDVFNTYQATIIEKI